MRTIHGLPAIVGNQLMLELIQREDLA